MMYASVNLKMECGHRGMAMKKCPKCGYSRQETDSKPEYECPKCGVIYERSLEAQERKRQQETVQQQKSDEKTRRNTILRKVLLWCVGLLAVFTVIKFGGVVGLGVLFLSPLAAYLYIHRHDKGPSPTAACPTCGGW